MFGRTPQKGYGIRVGLFCDGQILEESIVRPPGPVTVGSDERGATVSADLPEVPEKRTVVDWHEGGYVLRLGDDVEARLSDPAGLRSLAEPGADLQTDSKGRRYVRLTGEFSARVQIGELVVLLQRIPLPDEPTRPELPRELRGGWFASLDRRLATAIAAVAALQIGFVAWTQWKAWPQPSETLDTSVLDNFGQASVTPPPEREKTLPKKADQTEVEEPERPDDSNQRPDESNTEVASNETPDEPETDPNPPKPSQAAPAGDRNVGEDSSQGTVLEALGSEGGEDLMAQMETASPTAEMDEAIANASNPDVSEDASPKTSGSKSGDGTGMTFGGDNLGRTEGSRRAEQGRNTGEMTETGVSCDGCSVGLADPEGDPPESVPEGLDEVIERNMGRIRQCYNRALKKDNDLGGKVVVSFKLGATGEAIAVHTTADSVGSGVGPCIVGLFRTFAFPAPDGPSKRVSKTFVFEPGTASRAR